MAWLILLKVLLRWCKNFRSAKEGRIKSPTFSIKLYSTHLLLSFWPVWLSANDTGICFFMLSQACPEVWGQVWDETAQCTVGRFAVQTKIKLLCCPLLLSRHSNWASSLHLEIKNYKWKGPILTKCLRSYYTWYPHQNVNHNNHEQPCGVSTCSWYMALSGRSERVTNNIHSFLAVMKM